MRGWPNCRNSIYIGSQGFNFAYVPELTCMNWRSVLWCMAGLDDRLDTKRAHDKTRAAVFGVRR